MIFCMASKQSEKERKKERKKKRKEKKSNFKPNHAEPPHTCHQGWKRTPR